MACVSHFSDRQSNPTSPKSSMASPWSSPDTDLSDPRVLPWTMSLTGHTEFGLWCWLPFLFHTSVYFLQIFSCLGSPFLCSAEFCLMKIHHCLCICPSNEGLRHCCWVGAMTNTCVQVWAWMCLQTLWVNARVLIDDSIKTVLKSVRNHQGVSWSHPTTWAASQCLRIPAAPGFLRWFVGRAEVAVTAGDREKHLALLISLPWYRGRDLA